MSARILIPVVTSLFRLQKKRFPSVRTRKVHHLPEMNDAKLLPGKRVRRGRVESVRFHARRLSDLAAQNVLGVTDFPRKTKNFS